VRPEGDDYPMTAAVCQILGYDGYTYFMQIRSKKPTFVILCGDPERYLEHIQTKAMYMTNGEAEEKTKECERTEAKLTEVHVGQGSRENPSSWATLSKDDIEKCRNLDWSFLRVKNLSAGEGLSPEQMEGNVPCHRE
jgi:hypothetical protein